jgi:hypothetical protein
VSDTGADEWNDPPGLDADGSGDGEEGGSTVLGPVSFPDIVFGLHALVGVALLPFLVDAVRAGNLPLVGSLGLLIALLLTAGVFMRRIAARR